MNEGFVGHRHGGHEGFVRLTRAASFSSTRRSPGALIEPSRCHTAAHADDCRQVQVNGDELRSLALPEEYIGYLASDVDDLLLRVAGEMDAGRPVGELVANAAFRRPPPITLRQRARRREQPSRRAYNIRAVDWLLEQLRRGDERSGRAWMKADPWHDLAR
jgi:hypothetical protein